MQCPIESYFRVIGFVEKKITTELYSSRASRLGGFLYESFRLDQPTGPKTIDLLLTGKDPFLLSLVKQQKLFVSYDESGWPLEKRVGQHCSVLLEIINQFSMKQADRAIKLGNMPRYNEIVKNGVGYYDHDPSQAKKESVYYN